VCKTLRRRVGAMVGDVSSRKANLRSMMMMDLLCPNENELREAYGAFDKALPTVTWNLLEETRSRAAIVTMGPEGLVAFDRIEDAGEEAMASRVRAEHVPSMVPFAIDPLGCGDSLIAGSALAMASGGGLLAAAFVGSQAAAAQAQRIGNIPITAADLRQGIVRVHNARLAFAGAEVVAARGSRATVGV
jgi:sugar/nucleoside kinase (ribokinase family)